VSGRIISLVVSNRDRSRLAKRSLGRPPLRCSHFLSLFRAKAERDVSYV
jgi:hypothetical protein